MGNEVCPTGNVKYGGPVEELPVGVAEFLQHIECAASGCTDGVIPVHKLIGVVIIPNQVHI